MKTLIRDSIIIHIYDAHSYVHGREFFSDFRCYEANSGRFIFLFVVLSEFQLGVLGHLCYMSTLCVQERPIS